MTTRTATAAARRGLTMLGLVALGASALFGANVFGVRDRVLGTATPPPKRVAVSPFAAVKTAATPQKTVLRSYPWWQRVTRLHGDAATTAAFAIDSGATQWRVRWRCSEGRLLVRAAELATPVVDGACPGQGTGLATRTGSTRLAVSASGPWRIRVDQQIDVPLVEPPLPAMTAPGTTTVAAGDFHRIDQSTAGRLRMYRLAGGRYALRLEDFYVTPNVDLELRLSPLAAPASTRQFESAPSRLLAPLPITAGSLNFRVPAGVDPTRYRSVVVWCPPVHSAYAYAPLAPAP